MSGRSERAPAGSIADEAAQLLDAIQAWSRRALPDEHLATGAPECTWCPLCRLVAMLRGEQLETGERLAEAGTAVVAALRGLLDGATTSQERAPGRRVERIDLGADLDSGPGPGTRLDDADPGA